jgi:hypothetical protein
MRRGVCEDGMNLELLLASSLRLLVD